MLSLHAPGWPISGTCYSSEYHYYIPLWRMIMEKAISAAEANRKFSQLLQGVRQGRSYVVTSHGKPVAKISPVEESEKTQASARETLFARLRRQPAVQAGRWSREELYQDEP